LAIAGFPLATVTEGKTIKRAAIMVNNSLLSEVYCQNKLGQIKEQILCKVKEY
jgi:hypothetical protein